MGFLFYNLKTRNREYRQWPTEFLRFEMEIKV